MRLPATCRLVSFVRFVSFHSRCAGKLPALPAFRAAPRAFYPCAPHVIFPFCFACCPKHLRQYHFLCALSSLIAKIFFFFLFFLPADTVLSTVSHCRARPYFIHSLSTLYYYTALSLTARLTGDYRDRSYTGKCGPALLDHTIRTKARITKSEISMRIWRSPMSAASQGAFVVIPEISLCDISGIIKKRGPKSSEKSF